MRWQRELFWISLWLCSVGLLVAIAYAGPRSPVVECSTPTEIRKVWRKAAEEAGVSLEWYLNMRDGERMVVENKLSNIAGNPPYRYDRIDVMRSTGGGLMAPCFLLNAQLPML